MSYHDDVHQAAHRGAITAWRPGDMSRSVVVDFVLKAIPPLSLKLEDGRFVKAEPYTSLPYPMGATSQTLYCIIEEAS